MTKIDDALQHHHREADNHKYDMTGFEVHVATPQEWQQVTAWGNGESWNIGFHDAECFMPVDPQGFFLGTFQGRPVSAVSLVSYSDEFAVWGHYLVAPGERGKGYGIEVCKAASRHAGDRVTAGDGMPEQVENYSKDGSRPVYRTVHHLGELVEGVVADPSATPYCSEDLDDLIDLDATAFPARREVFLSRWLTAPGHRAFVRRSEAGHLEGYAVVRPAPAGYRVGPVVAVSTEAARALLRTSVADLDPGTTVSVFAPDVQEATRDLLAQLGLQEHFHVVRLYRGDPPPHDPRRMYAIGSLELG